MGRRPFVLCALAAGCIEIPPPAGATCDPGTDADRDGWRCDGRAPDCADGDPAIHPGAREILDDGIDQDCFEGDLTGALALPRVRIDDTERVVTMRGHQVVFPDVEGRYPTTIVERATGLELTYAGSEKPGLGIELESVHTTGSDESGNTVVRRRGDAVIEMTVDWTWTDPQDSSHVVATLTRFSFYPDDRIVRHDHVEIDGTWTPGSYLLASFVSVSPRAYTHVQPSSDEWPATLADVLDIWSEYREQDTPWVCAIAPGVREMALVVRPTGGNGAGPRILVTGEPGDERVELAYDWARYLSTPAGTHDESSLLAFATGSGDSCYAVALAGQDFLTPVALVARPDGGVLVVDDPGDADGDGFAEQRGAYVVASDGDHAEVRVQDDPWEPIVLESTLGADGAAGVTVWLEGARIGRDLDYVAQYDAALGTTTVWIGRPITAGSSVRIAGPGGEPAP